MAPGASRRVLQDGSEEALALIPDEEENLTGTFKVTVTFLPPEQNGLSTGALVGIVMGAFAVFLVALLILYRRGCFDKKNKKHKLPKTVTVEEASDASGDNSA
jgi:hypothetical protein